MNYLYLDKKRPAISIVSRVVQAVSSENDQYEISNVAEFGAAAVRRNFKAFKNQIRVGLKKSKKMAVGATKDISPLAKS